jgi:hypothetical protein
MSEVLRIDNSRRSCIATCLRKTKYVHELCLDPRYGSTALRYGSVFHSAMDGYYSYIKDNGWKEQGKALAFASMCAHEAWQDYDSNDQIFFEDYRTLPNLMTQLAAYVQHFAQDAVYTEILAAEQAFEITINPTEEIMKAFPNLEPFIFSGIIDLEVKLSGLPWILDYKTTGQAISLQSARMERSPQLIGYVYAGKYWLEVPPEGALVTFIHLSAYKSKVTNKYGNPKFDFGRFPQSYTQKDTADWLLSLCKRASEYKTARETDCWPMEYDSCFQFGKCSYLSLCEQHVENDGLDISEFITRDPWNPADVSERNSKRKAVLLDKLSQAISLKSLPEIPPVPKSEDPYAGMKEEY